MRTGIHHFSGSASSRSVFFLFITFLISFLPATPGYSQKFSTHADSVLITPATRFPLPILKEEVILSKSFRISPEIEPVEIVYDIQTKSVRITGLDSARFWGHSDTLYLVYQYLPFSLQKEYRRYTIGKTNAAGKEIQTAQATGTLQGLTGLWDDSRLRKSGSFVRGVTVGSNRDLTLNSGFRMELDGNLTDDVEISAVLSDENTPIQPEGNTQTLQELDKVFIELRHKNYTLTLGDYSLNEKEFSFSQFSRKLQGLMVSGRAGFGNARFAFANSKGKFNSNEFPGTDGNQGPYRLRGRYNEKFILVLAGTERVYLNGILKTRGETNDYIIDYASGEITFTPTVLITSSSRIVVDFEYSDRLYARDFYSAGAGVVLPGTWGEIKINALREADNKNAPIDLSLTEADKQTIRAAGNDPLKAVKSGVDSVGFSPETGLPAGNYIRVDSLISGSPVIFYRYAPGNPLAVYRVSFSEVKAGTGEYSRKTFGIYSYVGTGGNYSPVIFLPLPALTQVVNLKTNLKLADGLTLVQEFAGSERDENQFSDAGDEFNRDVAFSNLLEFRSNKVTAGSVELGNFTSSAYQKYVGQRFTFADRYEAVEYGRNWGFDEAEEGIERQIEWSGGWQYIKPVQVKTSVGSLSQGGQFNSQKMTFQFDEKLQDWVHSSWNLLRTTAKNKRLQTQTMWNQYSGKLSYPNPVLTPELSFLHEEKKVSGLENDSLHTDSRLSDEGDLGLAYSSGLISVSGNVKIRLDSEPDSGRFFLASRAYTQNFQFSLSEWKQFRTQLQLTNYFKEFTTRFREKGNPNTEATLIRWTTFFSPFNAAVESETDYQVNTQKTSRQDRIFIKVLKGFGNYIWVDSNENGIQEINEFELTRFDDGEYVLRTFPSEELEPVVDLKATWKIRLKPWKSEDFNFLPEWIVKKWSSETVLNLEEKSRTKNVSDVYFLRLGSFFNDSTTISGIQQWIQDLFYNEQNRDFNFRIRSDERRSLVQFSIDSELRRFSEKSIRVSWKPVTGIYTKTDAGFTRTQYDSRLNYREDFKIQSLFFSPDVSYRPGYTWEIGLKSSLDYRRQVNKTDRTALVWSEIARYSYSFTSKGRFRAELEYTGTRVKSDGNFPFELTNGNPDGKLLAWKVLLDYQITSFVSSFLSYDGRQINRDPVLHTFRAEVRAYF